MNKFVLPVAMMVLSLSTSIKAQNPAITFTTTTRTPITMEVACQDSTTLFIDSGDHQKVETIAIADSTVAFAPSGAKRTSLSITPVSDTIRIYGDNIRYFDASACGLTQIEIADAPLLRLDISSNALEAIDLTNLPELEYAELANNAITSLDVTKNPKLIRLVCTNLPIESIDLTQNPNLYFLQVGSTKLKSLDVTKNTKLGSLYALGIGLTDLDVSQNKEMIFLSVNDNKLQQLNLASCDTLIYLYATSNLFKDKSDVILPTQENNRVFKTLNLSKNQYSLSTLPELPPSPMTASRYTYAPQAPYQIQEVIEPNQTIDLSSQSSATGILSAPASTKYSWLTKGGTLLEKDTDYKETATGIFQFLKTQEDSVYCIMANTAFPKLTGTNAYRTTYAKVTLPAISFQTTKADNIEMTFACQDSVHLNIDWGNNMPTPTVMVADSATAFIAKGYKQTSIKGNVLGSTIKIYGDKIRYFDASACGLTQVEINDAPLLRLDVSSNALESINLTNLPELEYAELANNTISSLDVTKNPKLIRLVCTNLPIESIDLTQNPNLYYLQLGSTKLKSLDVTKNTKIGSLYALGIGLTDLDVSQNKKMFFLSVNDNKLQQLNLAACDTLIYLYATSNLFKEKSDVILPTQENNRVFKTLNLSKNQYSLSTLPELPASPMTASRYTYAPQAAYQIPEQIKIDETIDLSSEKSAQGILTAPVATTYSWLTKGGTLLVKNTDYEETSEGVFQFKTAPSDSVYCVMATTAFPKFTSTNTFRTTLAQISVGTGMNGAASNVPMAYGDEAVIRIQNTSNTHNLRILNLNGQTIYQGAPINEMKVAAGIYLVRIDDKTFKVVVK